MRNAFFISLFFLNAIRRSLCLPLFLTLVIKHLIDWLLLFCGGTESSILYLNMLLLIFVLSFLSAELVGLSICDWLVGFIAVLTVEAIWRIVVAFFGIEVHQCTLRVILDWPDQLFHYLQSWVYLFAKLLVLAGALRPPLLQLVHFFH